MFWDLVGAGLTDFFRGNEPCCLCWTLLTLQVLSLGCNSVREICDSVSSWGKGWTSIISVGRDCPDYVSLNISTGKVGNLLPTKDRTALVSTCSCSAYTWICVIIRLSQPFRLFCHHVSCFPAVIVEEDGCSIASSMWCTPALRPRLQYLSSTGTLQNDAIIKALAQADEKHGGSLTI